MNDQNPYDPYYPQPQLIGYDEYGQPVYQQVPPQGQQPQSYDAYDPYGAQQQGRQQGRQQGYGYDAYGQPVQPQQPQAPQQPQYDPYGQQQQHQRQQQDYRYSSYDTGQHTGQQWAVQPETAPAPAPPAAPVAAPPGVPGPRPAPEGGGDRDCRTEQFSFIEEPDEDSEDVIDWLKFTESRSERREEARRRARSRVVALIVVVALVLVGGVGYLWSEGKLPGMSAEEQQGNTATGPQKRDTIVVHLHDIKSGATSTALLVDNTTTGQGTTVLLPGSLSVANDDGIPTTLAKSVEDDGSSGTREAIGNLLGTKITGTWRLDSPFLENLVEVVSNVDLTTDVTVPSDKKGEDPLVTKGENQTLNGRAAVAYATYRAPGEAEAKQLQRFGQVLYAVLRKMSDDPKANADTIATLVMILDPSLPEKDLGASLAGLAERAKGGDYKTAVLPVEQDGSLTEAAAASVVKDILGGKVSAPEQGSAVRVSVRDATGKDATEPARVVLVNGGFAFVGGAEADTQETSQVLYGDDAKKATAVEVAKTLGLPDSAAKKGKPAGNADVTVVLGQDYKIPGSKK
ncbi:LCP family protein [Streptomyces sp. P9(2023)]|uniref:LCP family protein n=1 Tax=Streptomyces sp. P9(2023) TaxID=3064394 RepID=UPI0028F414A5|nr:LCP family protein [Streptomyces sp. P9(2023)]MDT9690649.1 LCP family protein [Streptomyces sp. P9(2023)]